MKKRLTKTELANEIKHLEIKARYAKKSSEDKKYPEDARNRFSEKLFAYRTEINELKKQLKKAKEIMEEPSKEEDLLNPAPLPFIDEDDLESEDREEIDFSDNKKAFETLKSLYPEGLDLD